MEVKYMVLIATELAILLGALMVTSSAGMHAVVDAVIEAAPRKSIIYEISEPTYCQTAYLRGMCTFPVEHDGRTYNECLRDSNSNSWCPPQETDEHDRKFWRECGSDCNTTSDAFLPSLGKRHSFTQTFLLYRLADSHL